MTDTPTDTPAADTGATVAQVKDTLDTIAAHLVPFLRAQQQVQDLNATIATLQKQRAARTERPLLLAVHRALVTMRRSDLAGLSQMGCVEFRPAVGDPFDPIRHNVVAGDGTGTEIVESYTAGIEIGGEVHIRADVAVGAVAPSGRVYPVPQSGESTS